MAASVIVSGVKVEGKISGDADVKIDGEVYGEIILANSSIFITQQGKAEADIKALNVFIAGEYKGNIVAQELIQISPSGRVQGELKAPYLAIEKGAMFSGKIEMSEAGATPEPEAVPVPVAVPAAAVAAELDQEDEQDLLAEEIQEETQDLDDLSKEA